MTKIHIALGQSRFDTSWKNVEVEWTKLAERLAKSTMTTEAHAEYMAMSREQQARIKDVGGFVGGWLSNGHRSANTVVDRSIITLDMDTVSSLDDIRARIASAIDITDAVIYSTHKYTPERPRLRLIVRLDKAVDPEAYEAIARKLAEQIGMQFFDPTTFQPSRLMYWPSHSRDIEPYYERLIGDPLDTDAWLAVYPDWHDVSFWPMPEGEAAVKHKAEKQKDPLAKPGVVGNFCRTYTIQAAIEKFLPDVYEASDKPNRYTYKAGTSHNGLVIYDDKFAYSNHATDPASMQLCNAFDLVRIHKFGDKDDGSDKSGQDAPSYKAMKELVLADPDCKLEAFHEKQAEASDDFSEPLPTDDSWMAKLERTEAGLKRGILKNPILILQNDPRLQGIGYNEMTGIIMATQPLPWDDVPHAWGDADDVQLCSYIEDHYGSLSRQTVQDAVVKVADDRRFNPLKEYLSSLPPWDGQKRIETLLIDYLGADDTPYVRAVTVNTLTAAIRRVYQPGVKFDYMLVLVGKTGIGKSTLWAKLGGKWFSDSLSLEDMRDKTAAEKLQGFWLLEIGEMQGARKADVNNVKSFLSRQSDNYRPAYGHHVVEHPRTCIIVGTTNEEGGFLRDQTGNRRFWPVIVPGNGTRSVWTLTDDEVAQIWAEAIELNKKGRQLHLSPELEKVAAGMQRQMLESDDRQGMVEEYLDTLLPEGWYDLPVDSRYDYFQHQDAEMRAKGTQQRTKVCPAEIRHECFGDRLTASDYNQSRAIGQIMAKMDGWEPSSGLRIQGYGHVRGWKRIAEK
jgi:predicted P-loop ATPase